MISVLLPQASQATGHIPPCLAWHTAVVIPSHNCMLVYGGGIITEEAKGKFECRTANWDIFAYYMKDNTWARMPRQKADPGETLHRQMLHRQGRNELLRTIEELPVNLQGEWETLLLRRCA